MGAIKIHKTAVDTKGGWDGPKAVAEALAEVAMLNHMHAWVEGKGDPGKKSSWTSTSRHKSDWDGCGQDRRRWHT